MSRCAFLTTYYSGCSPLEKTIEDLVSQWNNRYSIDIIIVDHSNIDTDYLPRGKLNDLINITIIDAKDKDVWWPGAMNIGLRYIVNDTKKYDYLILYNEDIYISADGIASLIKFLEDNPTYGGVGAVVVDDGSNVIIDAANYFSIVTARYRCPWRNKNISSMLELDKPFIDTEVLKGRCVVYNFEQVKEVGYFWEGSHYRSDVEYSIRIRRSGFKLAILPTSAVYTKNTQIDTTNIKLISYLFDKKSTQNIVSASKFFIRTYSILGVYFTLVFLASRLLFLVRLYGKKLF